MTKHPPYDEIARYRKSLGELQSTESPIFLEVFFLNSIDLITSYIPDFFRGFWESLINIPIISILLQSINDGFNWCGRYLWKVISKYFLYKSRDNTGSGEVDKHCLWIATWINTTYQKAQSKEKRWQQAVITTLSARDEVGQLLAKADSNWITPGARIAIFDLDKKLKQQADRIAKTRGLHKIQEFHQVKDHQWWWNPIHPSDRLDWLWNFLSIAFIAGALAIAADVASKFLAGGPTVWGTAAVIVPGLIGLLLGKEVLNQISSSLENTRKHLSIPKRFWQEVILVLAVLFFWASWHISQSLPAYSDRFYQKGRDLALPLKENKEILDQESATSGSAAAKKTELNFLDHILLCLVDSLDRTSASSKPEITKAESYLKTAAALNPDNSQANFALGFLYELRQDIDPAREQYKIATQNGSKLGRIRLAKLYLRNSKPNERKQSAAIAASILLQGEAYDLQEDDPNVPKDPDKLSQYQLQYKIIQQSWNESMAWARLDQELDYKAELYISKARNLHDKIPKQQQTIVTSCIQGEFLSRTAKKDSPESSDAIKLLRECESNGHANDPDENFWLARAYQHLKSLNQL
jgi:hypothetical protein